ncbi:hypothetical protein BZA70DRAFT_268162 [Myxozyma melibiosi]|uniref:RRM domain-containing protein n=1 Tax=Myxozyma melibiosi TaxID=54550 RepID=A0ABR1F382_9ASCO
MTATPQEDHPSPLRLYISSLPPALAHDPSDLISRLSLFGTPLTPLSVHKKPAALSSFAFVTVEMSKTQYVALRKSLNGVKYKGGVIKIDIARAPSFEERQKILREQHDDDDEERKKEQINIARKESLTRRKHLSALEKLMHHIRRSRYQFGKLEHGGRMRDNPRDFRKNPPTFRVKIGGKSKVVKCKKQKLWGAAKVGDLNEFVWRFDEEGERVVRDGKVLVGRWLNGYGDTVEVFRREIIQIDDFEKLKAEFDFGEAAASLTKDYNFEVVRSTAAEGKEETEEEKQQRVEREKSLKILQDMFGGANSDGDDDATATRKLEDEDSDDDDAIYQIINAAKPKQELETEEIEEETTEKDEKVVEMDDDEPEVDAMDVEEEKVQSEAESEDAESEDSGLFDGIEITAAEEQTPEVASEPGSESESDDSGLFDGIEIPDANADDDEDASDSDGSLAGKPYMPFYGLRGGAADYSESSSSEDSDQEEDESDEEESSVNNDSRKEEDTNSDSSESVSSSSDDDSESEEKSSADSDDSSDEESSSSSSESDEESSSEDEEEDKSRQKMEIDNAASDSSEHEATSSSPSSSGSESGSDSDSVSDSKVTTKKKVQKEDKPKKTVVTERLRSIFKENEESSASFSLFGGNESDSDDDVGAVDDDRDTNEAEDNIPQEHYDDDDDDDDDEEAAAPVITSRKRTQFDALPLFFPHPESAFLDAQSQFNKIPDRLPLAREQWKEEFYENRGEWTRKAKRRRRDAVRSRRKMEGGRKRQGRGEGEEGL